MMFDKIFLRVCLLHKRGARFVYLKKTKNGLLLEWEEGETEGERAFVMSQDDADRIIYRLKVAGEAIEKLTVIK